MATRLIVMHDGEIALDGKPIEVFKETEKLMAAGVDVPQITSLMRMLNKEGLHVDTNIFTVDCAVENLLTVLRGKRSAK